MDSILTNYKKDSDIEAELSNVDIENFVEFDYSETTHSGNVSIVQDHC